MATLIDPQKDPEVPAIRHDAAAGVFALAATAAIALWTGVWQAMQRPLWLDEIVTQLVATAPRGIIHAMRSGVDFQPPLHYALVSLSGAIAGGPSQVAARLPSLIAAALTLFVVAIVLRKAFSLPAALAGALTLAAHPLFIAQAFEARPYALWILATALLAEGLRDTRRTRAWLVAVAAVALCTTHYFGVLSLAAIAVGAAVHQRVIQRTPWTRTVRLLAPLAAGGVALCALLPLARTQLAATGGRSWVAAASTGDIAAFLSFPWGWRPAALMLALGVLILGVRRVPSLARRLPPAPRITLGAPVVALLATALVPVLVVLVTIFYKPVLVLRYSAPAVLAVAALCAIAVELFPPLVRWGAVLLLVRAGLFVFQSTATAAHNETLFLTSEVQTVRALATRGIPTISPFRHEAYRATLLGPGGPGVAWIELPDSLIERAAAAHITGLSRETLLVERDFGRAVRREFDFPAVISLERARTAPTVALLRDAANAPSDSLWFPNRQDCAISGRLVVFVASPSVEACGKLRAALQDAPSRR